MCLVLADMLESLSRSSELSELFAPLSFDRPSSQAYLIADLMQAKKLQRCRISGRLLQQRILTHDWAMIRPVFPD